jgi:hypothetical protein
VIPQQFPAHFPFPAKDQSHPPAYSDSVVRPCNWSFTSSTCDGSIWRVREPHRQGHLLASLAESGQQTPIVVVASNDGNYLVIDDYKRIAALRQLGRDTVEATVWPMGEAEALLLSRSQRMSPQQSALEQGWLMSESLSGIDLAERRINHLQAIIDEISPVSY